MMNKKQFLRILAAAWLLFCLQTGLGKTLVHAQVLIPTTGNSWVINNGLKTTENIGKDGIRFHSSFSKTFRTFFYAENTGQLKLGIRGQVSGGNARVKITVGKQEKIVEMANEALTILWAGDFTLKNPGYQQVDITSLSGDADVYISDVAVDGQPVESDFYFAKDDFYWGRRGPSVHLRYLVPETVKDVTYFYNEITVPEGEDVIGSYFMANGFGQGYFGIQVNSEEERRILFSVWSPFHTDNPDEIPEDQRINMLRKGEGVHTGEFGNEGSGGQSYKKFMWKAGVTYGFLLKGVPSGDNSTTFTAWFFDPEAGDWSLIASFDRPQTNTYLTGLHSFLENFIPQAGIYTRKVQYTNQWVVDAKGNWTELNQAAFSADATARKNSRLDYAGGQLGDAFYLKNCGFFTGKTDFGAEFIRKSKGEHPIINFNSLP
ncbi:DUF3472 domain-containing protein [Sunxiuqinia sp. sy24]|uniref:DUF3472 domain-containing protein n=1 Tax=Sunxiuqinia sp. sy24 TaxID=3461495 RepID=UPI0040452530